jgi:hypothetical protein
MKRIKIVGLCLVAVFALSAAVMASSASAAGPDFKWCSSVTKKTGKYSESKCATEDVVKGKDKGSFEKVSITPCKFVGKKGGYYTTSACTTFTEKKGNPEKKGEYEKECPPFNPNPAFNKVNECAFTDSTGPATLKTPAFGANNVTCKASTSAGEYTGNTTETDRATFTGCEFETLPCESSGPNSEPSGKAGVIVTDLLGGTLKGEGEAAGGYEGKTVPTGEAWINLVGDQHTDFSSEFNCDNVVFLRTTGSIAGPIKKADLNKLSTSSNVEFEEGKGEQGLLTEVNSPETGGNWVGPAPSIEEIPGGATISNTSEVETTP